MEKKVMLTLLILLSLSIFLYYLPLVGASIYIEQPSELYNLGERLTITTRLLYPEDFSGYIDLDLVCQEQEEIKQTIYFSPIQLEGSKEEQFTISFQVMKKGQCFFQGKLEDIRGNIIETGQTQEFSVSDLINIELEFNELFFMPGNEIEIKGTAIKANGQEVNALASISIEPKTIINQTNQSNQSNQIITFSVPIDNGKYNYKLKFSENSFPGDRKVEIILEDEYGNKGQESKEVSIAAVPIQILLEIGGGTENNPDMIMPGKAITIKPLLLDQANQVMEKNLSLKISKGKDILTEQIVISGQEISYSFAKNQKPGDYNVKIYGEGLEIEKTIYLAEIKEIDIELENDTLHIINIGNIPYREAIEITFTKDGFEETKIVDLDLDVGQEIYIKLEAPEGEYEVLISGPGENLQETIKFEGVPLTGEVVATVELEKETSSFPTWLIIILVGIILVLGSLYLISKRKRRKYENFSKPEKTISKPRIDKIEKKTKKTDKIENPNKKYQKSDLIKEKAMFPKKQDEFNSKVKSIFQKHSQRTGAKAIIPKLLFGNKRAITTVFMRIDGLNSLKKLYEQSPTTFEHILDDYFSKVVDKIRTYQGMADIYNGTIFIIFNAIKQYSHETAAIKTASDIRDETEKFNERYKPLAKFYVASGINTGTAILSTIKEDKQLKYLSLQNTTQIAKELEKKANSNDILLSHSTYERLKNSINAKQINPLLFDKEHIDTYSLEKLSLRDKYKDRIDKVVRNFKKY